MTAPHDDGMVAPRHDGMVGLAEHVATAGVGDAAVHAAVRCFVDWAGCAVGGSSHPASTAARAAVGALGEGDACTLVGSGSQQRGSQCGAALVNGTASHVLDFDDVNVRMIGHPGVVVIPAALAVAEAAGADGPSLCAGIAAGYEVARALGDQLNPSHYERGWHATATLGCPAAAAAASRVLGTDPETTARALSIALTQAGGVRAMFGSHGKAFHAGRAAAAGVLAAHLARAGLDVPADVLEGPAGYRHAAGLGGSWLASPHFGPTLGAVEMTAFKGHAACGATHCAADAVAALVAADRIDPAEIALIEVDVHPLAVRAAGIERPTTGLEAKFSLRHVAAQAVTVYPLLPTAFTDEAACDPDLGALRDRVRVSVDESFAYDEAMPARVRLTTADGTTRTRYVDVPRGRPGNPMTDDELGRKFLALASPVLGRTAAARALEALWHVGDAADVHAVATGLAR